jgi:hypothetical protein
MAGKEQERPIDERIPASFDIIVVAALSRLADDHFDVRKGDRAIVRFGQGCIRLGRWKARGL